MIQDDFMEDELMPQFTSTDHFMQAIDSIDFMAEEMEEDCHPDFYQMHEGTTFVVVSVPPLHLGRTWSIVRLCNS